MRKILLLLLLVLPTVGWGDVAVREAIKVGEQSFRLLEIGENIKQPWHNGEGRFQVTQRNGDILFEKTVDITRFLQYVPSEKSVLFQRVGGNAAGWGLYRFDIENHKLDYWDANAREIHVNRQSGIIQASFAHHNPNGGGYWEDDVKFYRWPQNMSQPEEIQPR